jgi:hypothetical protein
MGFVLKDRLKGLKLRIKDWNAEIFGNAEVKKKQLVEKILDLDLRSEGWEFLLLRYWFGNNSLWICGRYSRVLMLPFINDLVQDG